jgi:hypothetical protein
VVGGAAEQAASDPTIELGTSPVQTSDVTPVTTATTSAEAACPEGLIAGWTTHAKDPGAMAVASFDDWGRLVL